MYYQEFTQPTTEQINAEILRRVQKLDRVTKHDKERIAADTDGVLTRFVREISGLCAAIVAKRSVFVVLEKYPSRGLDYGRHWCSVYFVDGNGRINRFWPGDTVLAKVVGMDENNKDRSLPKWMFSSGAIGMDRILDATGGLGYFLRDCGAGYVQLSGSDII